MYGTSEIGLLTTVGAMMAKVYPTLTIAVLSNGDELVEPTDEYCSVHICTKGLHACKVVNMRIAQDDAAIFANIDIEFLWEMDFFKPLLQKRGILHFDKSTNNLLSKTCKQMVQGDPRLCYNICMAALEGVALKHHVKDLQGLGLVAANLIKANASGTLSHIKKFLMQKCLDPFYKGCLLNCQELYSDAIDNLRNAVDAFKLKDYFSANIRGSAIMDSTIISEDGFKEKKGKVSPLIKRN
ncbi:hypothetical protein Sjap_011502 [Stephania japonica]|uniref:Pectinesterase inhibitor domain-containing protein n=1 Tax=Stephania japonica TaxID=461633 RepID=A0AAP0JCI4_9MAGN